MTKTTKCKYCEDTGIVYVSNGGDDFDQDYCSCPAGQRLLEETERFTNTMKAVNLQKKMFNFVNKQLGVK